MANTWKNSDTSKVEERKVLTFSGTKKFCVVDLGFSQLLHHLFCEDSKYGKIPIRILIGFFGCLKSRRQEKVFVQETFRIQTFYMTNLTFLNSS